MTTVAARPAAPTAETTTSRAVIVLIDDASEARRLVHLLEDVVPVDAPVTTGFLAPPVRGMAFFGDASAQPALDTWWRDLALAASLPVWVVRHDPELAQWIDSVDGVFIVLISEHSEAAGYAGIERVRCVDDGVALDVAVAVCRELEAMIPGARGTSSEQAQPRGAQRFRRASLRELEGGLLPVAAVAPRGSEAFFHPTSEAAPPAGVRDEVIEVLADTLNALRRGGARPARAGG